jgi:hypothetical protein
LLSTVRPSLPESVMQLNLHIGAGAILTAALLAAAACYAYNTIGRPPEREVEAVTSGSKPPEFISTNGGMLTIAWVKGYESFEKRSPSESELKLPAGGSVRIPLPFGETISEISTAAQYQYQIALEKRWPIECSKTQCVIRTPKVQLVEPVAVYHEETRRKTKSGWARFDKTENLEQLNQSLGHALVARGNEPRNRDVALRDGRTEIEKFVREWMVKSTSGTRSVVVLYPGEQLVDGRPVASH